MVDSSAKADKIKTRTLCGVRKKGSAQKRMGICWKDTEANLKELPMAKAETIWAIK